MLVFSNLNTNVVFGACAVSRASPILTSQFAEWRHSGRHSDRSMEAIGRPKEAQWWYKEGRSVAQLDIMFTIVRGRTMADHCASILRPRRCVCLPPAFFERPVGDRPPRRPLCDCFEHAQDINGEHAVHGDV